MGAVSLGGISEPSLFRLLEGFSPGRMRDAIMLQRGSGGTGRRAGLRIQSLRGCEFESRLSHVLQEDGILVFVPRLHASPEKSGSY